MTLDKVKLAVVVVIMALGVFTLGYITYQSVFKQEYITSSTDPISGECVEEVYKIQPRYLANGDDEATAIKKHDLKPSHTNTCLEGVAN